jgi:hypothetical protein
MATYNQIVNASMRLLSLTQTGEAPTGEEYEVGIEALNDMVTGWRTRGLNMDYAAVSLDAGGTDAPFEEEDLGNIKDCLADVLAPIYGKTLSPQMALRAARAWDALYAKYNNAKRMRVDIAIQPNRRFARSQILSG